MKKREVDDGNQTMQKKKQILSEIQDTPIMVWEYIQHRNSK